MWNNFDLESIVNMCNHTTIQKVQKSREDLLPQITKNHILDRVYRCNRYHWSITKVQLKNFQGTTGNRTLEAYCMSQSNASISCRISCSNIHRETLLTHMNTYAAIAEYLAKFFRHRTIIFWGSQFLYNLLQPLTNGLHFLCQIFQLYLHGNKTFSNKDTLYGKWTVPQK